MHFTVQGFWIWAGLIFGAVGVFYYIGILFKLIKYKLTGHRCTGFVKELSQVTVNGQDKYILKLEYYVDGEKITGVQEDFVSLEKPFAAEAKYKPGEMFDIITGGKFPGRYVLLHRFNSSLGGAVAAAIGCALLAAVTAKLCLVGFTIPL
ncbi:MAG: hypothetical protein IJ737_06540 [Ruminococcus sp.]|nr:hypothetical protein [Ruminococcus sp.]